MLFLRIEYRSATSETNNTPSVPAIFDAVYFEQLSQLNQDQGAKEILLASQNEVYIVCADADLIDIDTQLEYE